MHARHEIVNSFLEDQDEEYGDAAGLVHTRDELVNSILEDEDELIAAHRRQIEDTMAIVRLEMNLLAEVCPCHQQIVDWNTWLACTPTVLLPSA